MANIQDSQLWMNDNAANGNVVDSPAWNQNMQLFKASINDNFQRLLRAVNVLDGNGNVTTQFNLPSVAGQTNALQLESSTSITATATVSGGTITVQFAVPSGGITAAMVGTALDGRYYTQSQVDTKINNATYTKTVQTGTSFPVGPYNDGQQFYREDQQLLYTYDITAANWIAAGKSYTAGSGITVSGTTIGNSGVLSVNGQTGAVTVQQLNVVTSPFI